MSNISTLTITGFLRAAFVFNKSLSVSFTVLITFYLLIEKGTSFNLKTQIKSIFCDSVIVFGLSGEAKGWKKCYSLFQLHINQEVL